MVVLLIAALHCLPPIIGALLMGRAGLVVGTAFGAVIAVLTGALAIPDLIGVAIGYGIGKGLLSPL